MPEVGTTSAGGKWIVGNYGNTLYNHALCAKLQP